MKTYGMGLKHQISWMLLLVLSSGAAMGAEDIKPAETEQVIKPQLERRNIKLPRIDTEDFEIGGFMGILSVENFGSNILVGGTITYHVTEDFFFDATYGQTTIADTAFRNFGLPFFPEEKQDYIYYNLSLGYNILPGEVFIGSRWAFNSAFYVIVGAGISSFAEEDRFTATAGFGVRMLLTDWFAMHLDTRDLIFRADTTGEEKITHNLGLYTGFTLFF